MNTDHDTRIAERIQLCKLEQKSYEIWLKTLSPANFLLVGVGGVLSLVAGLSIITEAETILKKEVAGWLAVLGAVLTGFHNRLKCEPHQAECRKLVNQFAELQTDYERLQLETDEKEKKIQLMTLEQKLAAIRAGRCVFPSESSIKKAKQEIKQVA